jgi:hypothetical protein
MEYTRALRLDAAKEALAQGARITDTALRYGFDTHAGFTRAFTAAYGCAPSEYASHAARKQNLSKRGVIIMKESTKIVIRSICQDDVNDLWENVYSAMTPRQITELKILPNIEREKRGEGVELVAQADGRVIMSLPMIKPFWIPVGYLFDNNFVLTGGENDGVMEKLLEEMKKRCRMINISTLVSPQQSGSESGKAFEHFGFTLGFVSGGWDYWMLAVE